MNSAPDSTLHHLPGASFWRRFLALNYDLLLVAALLFVATAGAMLVHGGPVDPTSPLFRLYLLLVTWAFFVGFWSHGGQTLGMKSWRLRVTKRDGSPLGWNRASLRFLAALATPGIGMLWCLVDRDRQGLYDRIAGSRCVVLPKGLPER